MIKISRRSADREIAAARRSVAQAYERYGIKWHGTDPARHPIQARSVWLERLNGWLQIAMLVAVTALVFGAGFVLGRLWEAAL